LSVANNFYQSWLEENYLPLIQQRPKYTFDTFVVGPSNSFPHAASLAVAQSPGRAYNPLFLYGGRPGQDPPDAGHRPYVQHTNKATVCYVSCETFTNEYIDALQKKALVQFRKKYRTVDLLLIDDIQFLGGKERMQEEFFHTFNALFDSHKQIVLTCDRPASEIPGLEHRLVSRFEWGLVTELEQPDVETRIAILRKQAGGVERAVAGGGHQLPRRNIRSNIRRLEGAPGPRRVLCSLTGRPLTIEVVEYLLRDTLDQEKQDESHREEIQKVVADYFDIRMGDMTSNRRPQNIAFPRQVAMYLCREMTDHSLPTIGAGLRPQPCHRAACLPPGGGPPEDRRHVPPEHGGPAAAPVQAHRLIDRVTALPNAHSPFLSYAAPVVPILMTTCAQPQDES
jgi:chromosomal replication initiator protein